jgi:hypothetical protein
VSADTGKKIGAPACFRIPEAATSDEERLDKPKIDLLLVYY